MNSDHIIQHDCMFVFNMYLCVFNRRKSKQALRDYKKVQIQLENLETSVRDRCKKEFTGQTLPHKHQPDCPHAGNPP